MKRLVTIVTIIALGKHSLALLKKTFFGPSGIVILVMAGLYIAGALIEPVRWYLVGVASALLILCCGLLAISYIRSFLRRISASLDELKMALHTSEITLAGLKKEIIDSKNTLTKVNIGNFTFFQLYNRQLTGDDLKRFAREWAPKLELSLDERALGYIAHRICLAEDTCVGRLAGNIETMLLRVMVARSVKEPDLEVLEIGTLFGVGVAMIYENCRGFFNNLHITIIDPLTGYGSDPLDTITKVPVTRDIFIHNMHQMNIPKSDYTIIEKLSIEQKAITQASKRRYNVLIIDGDHSYSGIKHDFSSYKHLVKQGGYIIFDDYDHPAFPAVKDFIDTEVVGLPELELILVDVRIAVFKVLSAQTYEPTKTEAQQEQLTGG